jgi:hypothetical protein
MKLHLALVSTQLTPEFWLASLTLTQEGKEPNIREFVVTQGQLGFLALIVSGFNDELGKMGT